MGLLWKAVRAVAVETLGVVTVVWLLFAGAGLTSQESEKGRPVDVRRAVRWAEDAAADVAETFQPELEKPTRDRYVEDRLGHYSSVYGEAAGDYLGRTAKELARKVTTRGRRDDPAMAAGLFRSL